MRRENLRKRNKLLLKNINKKTLNLIICFSIILILCLISYLFFFQNIFIKTNFEKDNINLSKLNENIPFSFNKIILFSSATANVENVNQSILSLDISQYCDIGIYLNNSDLQNVSIKSLYIDDILISSPELGKPCLYKKNIDDLGKCSFDENNIIQDNFYFNIVDTDSKINYSNYEIYNNGSTPISLGFYNKNIKENFLTDDKEILYNGSLLSKSSILKSNISCTVSFCINIITTSEEHYLCNINFDISFEDENNSIYTDGHFTKEINGEKINKFIRIK